MEFCLKIQVKKGFPDGCDCHVLSPGCNKAVWCGPNHLHHGLQPIFLTVRFLIQVLLVRDVISISISPD